MKKTIHIILLILLSAPVQAEIDKYAIPNESCSVMCFYWWPKLPSVEGWHHERDQSYNYSANAQAPDGYTFANAETVVYAKALYKPRIPETISLEQLIDDDKKNFIAKSGAIITEVEPLVTADGQILKTYTYYPENTGNWEVVAYGEEGDFYLVFTVSSRSKSGLEASLPAFKQFINGYRE